MSRHWHRNIQKYPQWSNVQKLFVCSCYKFVCVSYFCIFYDYIVLYLIIQLCACHAVHCIRVLSSCSTFPPKSVPASSPWKQCERLETLKQCVEWSHYHRRSQRGCSGCRAPQGWNTKPKFAGLTSCCYLNRWRRGVADPRSRGRGFESQPCTTAWKLWASFSHLWLVHDGWPLYG